MLLQLICLSLGWVPQTGNVSFPPGTYSYPDIASRLSQEGRKVVIAKGLEQRAALLSLHSRPVTEAGDLICRALDLHLDKLSAGTYEITLNKEIAKRDSVNLQRLTAVLVRDLTSNVSALRQELLQVRGLSDEEFFTALSHAQNEKRQIMQAAGSVRQSLLSQSAFEAFSTQPRLQSLAGVPQSWIETPASDTLLTALKAPNADGVLIGTGYSFDQSARELTLTFGLQGVMSPGRPLSGELMVSGYFVAQPGHSLSETFFAEVADAEARSTAQTDRAESAAILASAAHVAVPPSRQREWLSEYVEDWSVATKSEVVMPLEPRSDVKLGTKLVSPTLQDMVAKASNWQIRNDAGVLVFHDALHLVTQAFPAPVAAGLWLNNRSSAKDSLPVYPASDLLVYADAVSRAKETWQPRGTSLDSSYRGFDWEVADSAIVLLRMWQAVTQRGIRAGSADNVEIYSLGTLTDRELALTVEACRRSVTSFQPWLKDFPSTLRGMNLVIRRDPEGIANLSLQYRQSHPGTGKICRDCYLRLDPS